MGQPGSASATFGVLVVIEVSVLGSAIDGIGEARDADFGITGAKDTGMIYAKGDPPKKVPAEQFVEELFKEMRAPLER